MQVAATRQPDQRTPAWCNVTLSSPYSTTGTNITFVTNSTAGGKCILSVTQPVTIVANQPKICNVTCDNDVIGYTASGLINNVPFTTGYVPITVQTNPTDFVSTVIRDPFYDSNGGIGWSFVNSTLQANATTSNATGVTAWDFPFTTNTPAATSSQCGTFDTYAVDNTATLRTKGLNVSITSVTATAAIPCAQPSFGTGGNGTSNSTVSGILIQRFSYSVYAW